MEVTDETDPLPDPTEETRQESPPLDSPAEPEATEPVEEQEEQTTEEDNPPDSVEEKAVEKVAEPAARDKAGWEKLPKPLLPLFETLVGDLCADRNPSKAISELCHRAESIGETESLSPLLSTWFQEDIEALAAAVPVSYLVEELERGSPVLSRLFIDHWKKNNNSPKLERLADAAGNVRERLKNRDAGITLHELAIAVSLYKPVRAKRLIEMAAPLLDAEKDAPLVREAKEWQQAGEILKKFGPRGRDFWKPRLQNPEEEWDWSSTENQNALTQISFELAKDKAGPGLFGRFLKAEPADKEADNKPAPPEEPPATVEEKDVPTEPPEEKKTEVGKPADEVPPPPEPTKAPEAIEEAKPSAVVEPEAPPEAKPSLSERLDAAAKGRGKKEDIEFTKSQEENTVEEPVAATSPPASTPSPSPSPSPTPSPAMEPAPPAPQRSSGLMIAALFCAAAVSLGAYFWPQIQAKIMTPPATFVRTPITTPVVASVPVPPAPQPSPPAVAPVAETSAAATPSPAAMAPPPVVETTRTIPPTVSSPSVQARVDESLEIVKALPAVGRWAQRARSEPFAKVERLITGRETYLPQLSEDYSSLIKVLLLDPPSDATTRQVVCKQAVRCIPAVQLVPLFEKLVHQDSSNQADVKEAAKLLLQLRRESMGPSMSARLEQLISKAGD